MYLMSLMTRLKRVATDSATLLDVSAPGAEASMDRPSPADVEVQRLMKEGGAMPLPSAKLEAGRNKGRFGGCCFGLVSAEPVKFLWVSSRQ